MTGLFLVVGYVAQQGHQSLLGWDQGLLDPNEYVAIAGDFIWEVADNLMEVCRSSRALLAPGIDPVIWTSVLCLVLALAAIHDDRHVLKVLRRSASGSRAWKIFRSNSQATLAILLLLMVVVKAINLDVPTAKLKGFLVQSADDIPVAFSASPTALAAGVAKKGRWQMLAASSPEQFLSNAISCSRRVGCIDHDEAANVERAEFTAQIISAATVLCLSVLLLRRARSLRVASFAWIGVLSTMAVPYAYGKLGMSTERDFALIALKTRVDLAQDPGSSELRQILGVILSRDKDFITIATAQAVDCGDGQHAQLVRMWKIANSEVLWAREIFRSDVIAWKQTQEEPQCKGTDIKKATQGE